MRITALIGFTLAALVLTLTAGLAVFCAAGALLGKGDALAGLALMLGFCAIIQAVFVFIAWEGRE
jgi:hypothetical protein